MTNGGDRMEEKQTIRKVETIRSMAMIAIALVAGYAVGKGWLI